MHCQATHLHDFEDVVDSATDAKARPARHWTDHVVEAVPLWQLRVRQVRFSLSDSWTSVDFDLEKAEETFLDVDGPELVSRISLNITNFTFRHPAILHSEHHGVTAT